jgi:hypothetical protein
MYILNDIGFIAHPKTGSTSAKAYFEKYDWAVIETHHAFRPAWVHQHGLWHIGAVVRNPWDVMVSWYFHKGHSQREPFNVWLPKFIEGSDYIRRGLFFGYEYATHILQFEDLDHDWDLWLEAMGLPHWPLPNLNIGIGRDKRHYTEFYDTESRDLVAARFAEEIQTLEYEYDR